MQRWIEREDRIQDGANLKLFTDPWFYGSSLLEKVGDRLRYSLGLDPHVQLSIFIHNGRWALPVG